MKFAIHVPFGIKDWKLFFDIFYPEYFHGVELPVDLLKYPELPLLLKKNKQSVVNVIEIMENHLLRNAAIQDPTVKETIFEHVNSYLIKKYNFCIESYLLDVGFAPSNKNINEHILRINFLKKYIYSLYTLKRTASIPININSDFSLEKYSDYYFKIIQDCMFNLFKLCLNIFPHDLKSTIQPEKIYDTFIFDINNIRIIYEPDTGNYLTEKLFMYWLKPLIKYNYSGNIILVPKTQSSTIYENEVKKISTIIEKLTSVLL